MIRPKGTNANMLVITRKLDEKVNLYRDGRRIASVVLVDIRPGGVPEQGRVRLGIDAPHDVAIFREEIEALYPDLRTQARHVPCLPLALSGPSQCGKDTVAEWFRDNCGLRYGRSTSAVICPHIAAEDGISFEEAFARRHEDRERWFRKGIELRKDDPAALVREVVKDGDIVVGVRDGAEFRAARDQGLFRLSIWIDRDVPDDPTLTYGPEECDLRLDNFDGIPELHRRLERLARGLGIAKLQAPAAVTRAS